MHRVILLIFLFTTMSSNLFPDHEKLFFGLYGVHGNQVFIDDSTSVSITNFKGPAGREINELSSDINNDGNVEFIVFLKKEINGAIENYRIVVTNENYTPISTSASFPTSGTNIQLTNAGIIPIKNEEKAIYVQVVSENDGFIRKFEWIYSFQNNKLSLFYFLPSSEENNQGGIDLHSFFTNHQSTIILVESPEFWVYMPDNSDYKQSIWSTPGDIWFKPEFYGFAPFQYRLSGKTYRLNPTEISFFYALPDNEDVFPASSWILAFEHRHDYYSIIWSAYLGFNFTQFTSSLNQFDPSFKVIGGLTDNFLEIMIHIQDSEITEDKDLFRIVLSSPEDPTNILDVGFYPSLTGNDDMKFEVFSTNSFEENIKVHRLSFSEEGLIVLVEIPLENLSQSLNIQKELNLLSGFFKYRDFDSDGIIHIESPSRANLNDPTSWGNIIIGNLEIKKY